MEIIALLESLGYLHSERHWVTPESADPRLSYYYGLAQKAGVEAGEGAEIVGSYVYQTSSENKLLPPRPAVFVARAENNEQAIKIHKHIWNLGNCPFIIIVLPDRVNVYSGFDYSSTDPTKALVTQEANFLPGTLPASLSGFNAESIDTGRIWKDQAEHLDSNTRVDYRLLANLHELGQILQNTHGVSRKLSHALVGKYIYFRYLNDRGILKEDWMREKGIPPEDVFGRAATARGFEALAEALQEQFNGDIFPLPTDDNEQWRENDAVPFLARTFYGDDPSGQMVLDFGVYDFSYIPVELLSSIYEQFLKDEDPNTKKQNGVVYTPEALADYVLAELDVAHPLKLEHKILDPCCGSGVFLVLAYRRLIEKLHISQGTRPSGEAMKRLLQENIFGVEKDIEACHITAFSLILTLLSQLRPPDLQANVAFQFPSLVNQNIHHADFFDDACPLFGTSHKFDWIVGNPPWTDADGKNAEHKQVLEWQHEAESEGKFVGERRLDESFTWRAGELLKENGYAGLLIKATTLVNSTSAKYRKSFFANHYVRRVTNLSNLRRILFIGAEAPAACVVYRNSILGDHKKSILHFGPFVADQIPVRTNRRRRRVWTIALYESDIQEINYSDAEDDLPCLWKTALWGGFQDRRALRRLSKVLTQNLKEIIDERGWIVHGGPHIKQSQNTTRTRVSSGNFISAPELEGQRILESSQLKTKFIIPDVALPLLEPERQFIEKRKGPVGLQLISAPHLLVTAEIAVYSDLDFVIPAPKVGIAAPHEDADYLKAVALYLNSSVARYAHFFNNAPWGVYMASVSPEGVGAIPFTKLSSHQVRTLSRAYDNFAEQERIYAGEHELLAKPPLDFRDATDDVVEEALKIPIDVSTIVRDFMRVKYQLLEGKTGDSASRMPTPVDLTRYAEQLRLQVDDFAQRHHQITIHMEPEAVIATIKVTSEGNTLPIQINVNQTRAARAVLDLVRERHSQWAYVQRSIRIFDGSCVHIIKTPRLLDWTQTQAIQDAIDLIAEILDRNTPENDRAT